MQMIDLVPIIMSSVPIYVTFATVPPYLCAHGHGVCEKDTFNLKFEDFTASKFQPQGGARGPVAVTGHGHQLEVPRLTMMMLGRSRSSRFHGAVTTMTYSSSPAQPARLG